MSVFTPVNVAAPLDKKKALLQKLMEQYQSSASRASGLSRGVPQIAGLGTAAHGGRPFGGGGLMTGLSPNLASALARLLGPGGFGHGIPGLDSSAAPGMLVANRLGATPHGIPANREPGPAIPAGGVPSGNAAAAPQLPSGTANAPRTAPGAAGYNGYDAPQGGTAALDPGFNISSGMIPLGNGMFYDPVNDVLVGGSGQMPNVQTGARAGGTFSAV